jgi:hypothetical protein
MVAHRLRPENIEERLVYWSLLSMWAFWAVGATYVVFSLLGWVLFLLALGRRLGWLEVTHNHVERPSPVIVSAWLAGMLIMLVALIVGHIDNGYSVPQTVKSTLGWVKGWGLIGAYIFAGAMTHVRPQLIFRAMNILGLQTLLFTPVMILGALLHVPTTLFVSPLHYIVGSGEVFFAVGFYMFDSSTLGFRLSYFAPWAPAAAFFGIVAFSLALFDKSALWRWIGIAAAISMCVFSASRLALVAIPLIVLVLWVTGNITRLWMLCLLSATIIAALLFIDPILEVVRDLEAAFTGARADSSRVRATLQRIAVHRWESEAYWFGHATVEPGPHLVEYMMIGSHHTWNGLLFVKGLVGFLACLLPFAWTMLELLARSMRDRIARAGLGAMLALLLFSFGENMEMLVYIIWPAFLLLGVVAKRRISFPPEQRAAPRKFAELMAAAVVEVPTQTPSRGTR